MEPRGTGFLIFSYSSPVFKGITVTLTGIVAILLAYWMIKRWKEPMTWQFKIFIGLGTFITLYGLFILIFQPQWWLPPWWPNAK